MGPDIPHVPIKRRPLFSVFSINFISLLDHRWFDPKTGLTVVHYVVPPYDIFVLLFLFSTVFRDRDIVISRWIDQVS
jgi:hypothetical protein